MKKFPILATVVFCLFAPVMAATAQPLPQISLKPVFTQLQDDRPVWMSEAPDGSDRFFIVYQKGKIVVVKKVPTAVMPKPFWTSKIAILILPTRTG
jgi:hypothetical protein